MAPPVEIFTCGLLSQIGKLALAAIHPGKYGDALQQAAGQPDARLLALEEENFGLNHAAISAAMMAVWGIPKFFSDGVLFQETPELAGYSENSRRARLVWCFHLVWRMAALCFMDEAARSEQMFRLYPVGQKLDWMPKCSSASATR